MKRGHCILLVLIFILAAWCNVSAEATKNTEDYAALFPLPLAGWEASAVTVKESEREMDLDVDTLFGAKEKKRLVLTRIYRTSNVQGGTITILIDTWECAYNMFIPSTPSAKKELEESDSDMKPFTYQSYNGVKAYENKKLMEILLSLDRCRGFGISSDKVDDENIIMEYLKRTDLQKIHAFMKQH
jgi:hypothetical protein